MSHRTVTQRRRLPLVALALALSGALLGAPAALAQKPAQKAAPAKGAEETITTSGGYLAGRFAHFHGNPTAAVEFYRRVLKDQPDNLDVSRRLLALLVSEGRIDEALAVARTIAGKTGASEEDDDGSLAALSLAVADIKAGDFAKSEQAFAQFPNSGLATITAPLLRAWSLAGLKQFDEALKVLSVDGANQGFAILYGAHAAAINELAGRSEAAEKGYLQSMEGRQGANLRLTQLLGNFYERTGHKDRARALYDQYMSEHPTSTMLTEAYRRLAEGQPPKPEIGTASEGAAEALFSLAGSVQQQSAFQAIIFARLAVHLKPEFSIARLLIAETLEADRRFEDAIALYRGVTSDANYSWAARLRIADALDSLERPDDAVAELRQMAREEAKRYDALVRMGDILRRHERYEEATKAYEQAKARVGEPENQHWPLFYASGIAYERTKRWDNAEADFLKALELEPEQPYVLNYLGYSWVEIGKNLDKARAMIELAVKKRPRDGYIVDSLGWVLYRLGDIDGAVKQLERAIALRPEDPTINDHLGDVYWKVGRRDEARFQWQRALTLEPEEELIPKIKQKLKDGLPST